MDKQARKEFISRAKRLIDSRLSTGKRFSNIELYEMLESEFHILGFTKSNFDTDCMNVSGLSERNYRLSLEYGPFLKEIIRWIKQQITNQGKQVSEYLEIEVYPQDKRRSLYSYKKKGYSIYGNEISAKFLSKMDAVIRDMEEDSAWSKSLDLSLSESQPDVISHPVSLIGMDRCIQNRIDEMVRLKQHQLSNIFFENLYYFTYYLDDYPNDNSFHSELKKSLDESRKIFDNNEPLSMLALYLATQCISYTNEERVNFGLNWFNIACAYNDESYEWLFMFLHITRTLVYLTIDSINAKVHIEKCISIIEPIDRLDEDLAEIYSNLCALYTIRYLKNYDDEKSAVQFGERFIEWVKTHKIKGNPSIANVLYFLSVEYASRAFGYDDIKAEYYIKQAIAIMEELQPCLLREKEQLADCYTHLADIYSHYSLSLKYPDMFCNIDTRIITDSNKVSEECIQSLRDKARKALT